MIRILNAIQKCYPKVDYHCKLGGLDKWDGYNNQPLVYIALVYNDDPICMDNKYNSEAVQRLKNIMSHGDVQVGIKGGCMVFDSSLIIITSNLDPRDLAQSCGIDNFQAIFRRLTDTCSAHQVQTRDDCKMTEYTVGMIKENIRHHMAALNS